MEIADFFETSFCWHCHCLKPHPIHFSSQSPTRKLPQVHRCILHACAFLRNYFKLLPPCLIWIYRRNAVRTPYHPLSYSCQREPGVVTHLSGPCYCCCELEPAEAAACTAELPGSGPATQVSCPEAAGAAAAAAGSCRAAAERGLFLRRRPQALQSSVGPQWRQVGVSVVPHSSHLSLAERLAADAPPASASPLPSRPRRLAPAAAGLSWRRLRLGALPGRASAAAPCPARPCTMRAKTVQSCPGSGSHDISAATFISQNFDFVSPKKFVSTN